MTPSFPTPEEFAAFKALRERVMLAVAKELAIDDCCKSYEGHMLIGFPHYFDELETDPRWRSGYRVDLNCYVLGPTRHYSWEAPTLGEAVAKADESLSLWIKERGKYTV